MRVAKTITYEELAKQIPCSVDQIKKLVKEDVLYHAVVKGPEGTNQTVIHFYPNTVSYIRGILKGHHSIQAVERRTLSRRWKSVIAMDKKHCHGKRELYHAIHTGKVHAVKCASRYFVIEDDVKAYCKASKLKAGQPQKKKGLLRTWLSTPVRLSRCLLV